MRQDQSENLIQFWRRYEICRPPYWHPDDREGLVQSGYIHDEDLEFSDFLKSEWFGNPKDSRFHPSLIPVPFLGDLENSDIWVLMLNPGFDIIEYATQSSFDTYRDRLRRNLRQDFSYLDFPFIGFDPEFCWTGCFAWWERKFRYLLTTIAKRNSQSRYSYLDALKFLSERVAVIQLVPYFSVSFAAAPLLHRLASVKKAKAYVHQAEEEGKKLIIVTRGCSAWALKAVEGRVVVYQNHQARSASLGPDSPGAKAILGRLGIAP